MTQLEGLRCRKAVPPRRSRKGATFRAYATKGSCEMSRTSQYGKAGNTLQCAFENQHLFQPLSQVHRPGCAAAGALEL